ncbi:MAG TPA: methylmalonyl-CoA mutase subunit beta [Pseudolabrys sp.]|nr:methylmalonyl-CoA mutase subunit beta [Pseudolabrys sp.]
MRPMSDQLPLAAEFPPTSEAEWRKLTEAALKGASFDKLVSQTYDGLRLQPLYPRARDARAVAGRAAQAWQVLQRADHPDPKTANKQALDDLENGASGLALIFAGAPAAHGYGVAINNAGDLDRALAGVMLDIVSLRLETAPFAGRPVAMLIAGLVAARKLDPAALDIDFGLDLLGDTVRSGGAILPWPDLSARAGATAKDLAAKGFAKARLLRADGRAVHDAGGSEAQELAFAIATGVAYLRLLEAAGFALDEARRRISFLMAADADEFLTIAKFRALRKVWARVEQACGLAPMPAFVAAETAWRMMTRRDPYVNMLRATVAVTAAGVGGADAIDVLPFTAALGLPDAFARRVARNTQLILIEESNLAKVSDPAAGAGGIEAMTDTLAHAAWALFQEIEQAGGAAAAIEQGLIQKKVASVRAAREAAAARRKDALTGASDYPNLAETPVAVLDVAEVGVAPSKAAVMVEALSPIRLAEPFERLRDASDRMLAKTGARPKVFLANLGRLSDFTARATFTKNFYEAGGIEAVTNDGFKNRADMLAAFDASGAKLACLCSSDEVYAREAADAAAALTKAGAIVSLAGRPGEHEAQWRQAGVKSFIYMGCDALAALRAAHDILGK